jgi:alpha-N-arabinofuranosidase
MNRRHFLATAASLAAGPQLFSRQSRTADSRIEILLEEPGATIAPEIYGHFVEHLGGVVYDGIWVGEQSTIPHVNGVRKELIEALRKVKPGMIRWPGGCFADQYDWRDGIGPRDKRPRRTNFWVDAEEWAPAANKRGPHVYEPNLFGTVEFARFCEQVNAQPYFAANLRSLPAEQLYRWVEYCNSPAGSTTLADQRAADGHADPIGVRFWGVGNESWGCGGNFDPEDYASEFRRYTAWVPSYGTKLALVGSGPNDDNFGWTRRVFAKLGPSALSNMWGWAMHHYSWNASGHPHAEWYKAKSDALKFDARQYYSILRDAEDTERLIQTHWDVMAESDPGHKVKLVVDEWGAWHAPGTEPFPEALLGQQNTMADAVVAGLTLDMFNRHADKIGMASVAQLVNNLQSLFFAHENRFCLTPTYHVFDMYSPHQTGRSIRTVISAPEIPYTWDGKPAGLGGLSSSASLKGSTLTVTVTNPSLDSVRGAEIVVRGGRLRNSSATVLAAKDIHAHNSFDNPRSVEPAPVATKIDGSVIQHQFPAGSVTKLEVTIG